MKKNREFFIGWQDKFPDEYRFFYRRLKWPVIICLILLSAIVVTLQNPFNDHQFDFGNPQEITGIYYDLPVPLLVAEEGSFPAELSRNILLVGYGKMGAEGIMEKIEAEQGDLHGRRIVLVGTLIYGDGKTLLELTDEEDSFVEMLNNQMGEMPRIQGRSPVSLSGEIVDPKCYFGVMKPGEGKIHKSCAIRCISGGIPPIFRHETGSEQEKYRYYLMLDENNNKINREVLPFVAERMNLQGNSSEFMGWDIVYVEIEQLALRQK